MPPPPLLALNSSSVISDSLFLPNICCRLHIHIHAHVHVQVCVYGAINYSDDACALNVGFALWKKLEYENNDTESRVRRDEIVKAPLSYLYSDRTAVYPYIHTYIPLFQKSASGRVQILQPSRSLSCMRTTRKGDTERKREHIRKDMTTDTRMRT